MYIYIYMYVYGPSLSLLHSSTCWSPGKPSWPCPGLLAASPLYPGKARGNRQYKQTIQDIIENDHRAKSLVNHCWPNCYTTVGWIRSNDGIQNTIVMLRVRRVFVEFCFMRTSMSKIGLLPIAYCLLPDA